VARSSSPLIKDHLAAGASRLTAIVALLVTIGPARAPGSIPSPQSPVRPDASAPVAGYTVQHTYPHDPNAFTQGLEYWRGYLYESTGLNGRSSIRKVELHSGKILRQRAVPRAHFGEGITLWKSALIELTWQSQVAFVYDRDTFEPRGTFSYTGEGWGLTHDATDLIMSDGTAELRFLDPETFRERRRIKVTDGGRPVTRLNELEYVKGQVFANIWTTDTIARVDPVSGRVLGWIDLRGLLPGRDRVGSDAVLNGIAYDEAGDRLFVTGKLWPSLFEIKIVRFSDSRARGVP
jgi:glutamine cyclotransferase